jgi:hypothetical protein
LTLGNTFANHVVSRLLQKEHLHAIRPTAAIEPETTSLKDDLGEPRARGFTLGHPVLAYYVLTFAISWGGILLVVGGPGGIPGTADQIASLMPLAIIFMLFGPSLAGILMTGLVAGRKDFATCCYTCSSGESGWRGRR